jgi:hypothetical protein
MDKVRTTTIEERRDFLGRGQCYEQRRRVLRKKKMREDAEAAKPGNMSYLTENVDDYLLNGYPFKCRQERLFSRNSFKSTSRTLS